MGQEGCRGKVKMLWCLGRAQDEEEARGKDAGVSGRGICSPSSIPDALLQFSAMLCAVPPCSVSLVPSRLPPPVPAVRGRPAGQRQRVPQVPARAAPAAGGSLPARLPPGTLRRARSLQT